MNYPPPCSVNTNASTKLIKNTLFAAIAATTLITGSAFAKNKEQPTVPQINWQSCGADFPGIECATVKVPLDYDKPRGATTDIAIARYPASDQANKIGSLFLNPGGPGGSGADLILFGFGEFLDQTLLGRFDVVGWDPRGVGASTPIQCWDSNAARNQYFEGSPVFPYLQSQERPFFELNRNIANECFKRPNQPILRNMSTADVVRDLDLLRQAVGDEKLTYLGYSYGSHIGNTYANLFPNKVRALVIDGVLNPILWGGGLQIVADRTASFEVLKEFFKLCDSAGSSCPLSGPNGAKARFDIVRNFVRETPIILDDGAGGEFVYSYDFFVADSAGVMYSPEQWAGYADFIGFLSSALEGNQAASVKAFQARQKMQQAFAKASPRREIYNNGTEAFFGNHCADADYPLPFLPIYSIIGKYAEAGSFQGPFWWWGNSACSAWPSAADRYNGPWTAKTSSPVLVVGNFFDPATDYAGAVASDRLLQNSRLLSYAGWGHTAAYSGRSACVDDYVSLYLLDGSLPPKGTVCPAAANPFATTAAAAKSRAANARVPMVGLPTLKPLPSR
jgi:pimeloyl-ACP methyl ester carboxylesterase